MNHAFFIFLISALSVGSNLKCPTDPIQIPTSPKKSSRSASFGNGCAICCVAPVLPGECQNCNKQQISPGSSPAALAILYSLMHPQHPGKTSSKK